MHQQKLLICFLFLLPVVVLTWDPLPTMDEWKTWTLEELEKQMSPSRWNPKKSPDEVINQFLQVCSTGTIKARKSVAHTLDVSYGALPNEKIDIYGTDLPEDSPLLFWIHGGYWQEGTKDISGYFANVLHGWGFKTVVFGYTLAPEATIGKMEGELTLALKRVTQIYPKSSIVIGGHSAGGQLASSVITGNTFSLIPSLQHQLKGLFLVAGVFDLRPLVQTSVNKALQLTPIVAQNLSALFKDVSPPWLNIPLRNFVIVGDNDSPEFKRQSTGYYEILKSLFDTQFWVSATDDHFEIVENLATETSDVSQQLKEYLKKFHDIKDEPNLSSSPSASESTLKPGAAAASITGSLLGLLTLSLSFL